MRDLRRRLVRAGVRTAEAGLAAAGVEPPRVLLLLGHMRSGSTLLLHLLMTDREIVSVGEGSRIFATPADLRRLVIATRLARRMPFAQLRYVAAQINHSHFTPDPGLFDDARVRTLFLLRGPEASIASLLELTRTHYQAAWSVERAVDYYVERVGRLGDYGRALSRRESGAFLTYEDLIDRPQALLARLQGFLGTENGFSDSYAVQHFTGERGDPSANIRTGRVGRPRSAPRGELPPALLARAMDAHRRACEALSGLALLAPTAPAPA